MQAAVSKQCEATVGGFNNTGSAVGGLLASTAYGSLEIVMLMNGISPQMFPWNVFTAL